MIKTRLFTGNIGNTEKWINQYVSQGFRLERVDGISFRFTELPEGEKGRQIKIDWRTFQKEEDFRDYIALFEDSGWKHISGTKASGMQYFERRDEMAGEDIFSDTVSKAERYKRIANMWLTSMGIYLPVLFGFYCTGALKMPQFSNWKDFYYTPGLWEETGMRFLGKFLFETPFAMGRLIGGGIPFLILVVLYGFFGLKALYWYYREKKEI